jgi:hypothetical protein
MSHFNNHSHHSQTSCATGSNAVSETASKQQTQYGNHQPWNTVEGLINKMDDVESSMQKQPGGVLATCVIFTKPGQRKPKAAWRSAMQAKYNLAQDELKQMIAGHLKHGYEAVVVASINAKDSDYAISFSKVDPDREEDLMAQVQAQGFTVVGVKM